MVITEDHYEVVETGCWLWKGQHYSNGYGTINRGRRSWLAHRIMFQQVHGFLPKLVMHTCDVKNCVNPEHLKAGTHSENMRDARDKGRLNTQTHEFHGSAKLTMTDAEQIRALKGIVTQRDLAKRYGVSRGTIQAIHDGRTWN